MSTDVRGEEVANLGDLLERLGNIPPRRVVLDPSPGKATEEDLLRLMRRTDRLYELVEGTLVEKAMGFKEGMLAGWLIRLFGRFLDAHDLGDVGGADTTMRLMPHLVRMPDVAVIRWEKLPGRQLPTEAIPDLAPDLAVEVLSEGNTPGEMKKKLREYFFSGVAIVWLVDPGKRIVRVHTSPDEGAVFTEADTLDGGDVLPGFTLPVKRVFERLPPGPAAKARKPRKK